MGKIANNYNKITLLTTLIGILGFVCAFKSPDQTLPIHKVIGQWESISMYVKVKSVNNMDTNYVVMATKDNWEKVLQQKPIILDINSDQTFKFTYRNLQSVVTKETSGNWKIVTGDTIVFTQTKPNYSIYRYHLTLNEDKGIFRGKIDFDKDGKVDDEYTGISRKIK